MTTTEATRRCTCGAVLRRLNADPLCSPCDSAAISRRLRALPSVDLRDDERRRQRIVEMLTERRLCLAQIAARLGVDSPTASSDLVDLIGDGKVRRGPKVMGLRTYELAG